MQLANLHEADFSCHAARRGTAAHGRVRCVVAISIVQWPSSSQAVTFSIGKLAIWDVIWRKIITKFCGNLVQKAKHHHHHHHIYLFTK